MKTKRQTGKGRVFSFLLSVLLMVSLLPMMAFANEEIPVIDETPVVEAEDAEESTDPGSGETKLDSGLLVPKNPGLDVIEEPEETPPMAIMPMANMPTAIMPMADDLSGLLITQRDLGFHCSGGTGGHSVDPAGYAKGTQQFFGQLAAGLWVLLKQIPNGDGTFRYEINSDFKCPDCGKTYWASYSNKSDDPGSIFKGNNIQVSHYTLPFDTLDPPELSFMKAVEGDPDWPADGFAFRVYKTDAAGNKLVPVTVLTTVYATSSNPVASLNNWFATWGINQGVNFLGWYVVEEVVPPNWEQTSYNSGLRFEITHEVFINGLRGKVQYYADWIDGLPDEPVISNKYNLKFAQTVLVANKTTSGDGQPLEWSFDFGLYKSNAAGEVFDPLVIDSATNDDPSAESETIHFTAAGTYYFLIREESTDGDGWTSDPTQYLVKVVLVDQGGELVVTERTYQKRNGYSGPWSQDSYPYSYLAVTFDNSYQAEPVDLDLKATKKTSGLNIPAGWEFHFALFESDVTGMEGAQIGVTKTSTQTAPTVTFDTITYTSAGIYFYILREPETDGSGWTMDQIQYFISVVVEDHSGQLVITEVSYQTRDGEEGDWAPIEGIEYDDDSVVFDNEYQSEPAFWGPVATKTAAGRAVAAGQFEFALYNSNPAGAQGDLIESKTNDSAGMTSLVTFSDMKYETVTGDTPHYYLLKETSTDGKGWTVDETLYLFTVEVSDDGEGQLVAAPVSYKISTDGGDTWGDWMDYSELGLGGAPFRNSYSAEGSFPLTGMKVSNLSEASFYDGLLPAFKFIVTDVTAADEDDWFVVATGTSDASGLITFNPQIIEYEISLAKYDVGRYVYRISEEKGPSFPAHWTCLTGDIYLYVEVTDDAEGNLIVKLYEDSGYSVEITTNPENPDLKQLSLHLTFRNVYSAAGGISFEGLKDTQGAPMIAGQFNFTVTDITSADEEEWFIVTGVTGTNDADGNIIFTPLAYALDEELGLDDRGVHVYLISENTPGSNWISLTHPITVYVEVKDGPLDGFLDVKAYYDPECTIPLTKEDLTFENELVKQIKILKEIVGNPAPFGADDEFIVRIKDRGAAVDEYLTFRLEPNASTDEYSVYVYAVQDDANPDPDITGDIKISVNKPAFIACLPFPEGTTQRDLIVEEIGGDTMGWAFAGSINYPGGADYVTITYHDPEGDIPATQLVTVTNAYEPAKILVELVKDTILRTSAAYSSTAQGIAEEGIENVGKEKIVYEINFRSASNVALDSFIVEDPLEGVADNKFRLTELWTPAVFGLIGHTPGLKDTANQIEKYYIINYKTNKNNTWQEWAKVPENGFDYPLRVSGIIPNIKNEWVTALQFDFGAVEAGFTTMEGKKDLFNGCYKEKGELNPGLIRTDEKNISMLFAPIRAYAADPPYVIWPKVIWPEADEGFKLYPATLVVDTIRPLNSDSVNDIIGSAYAVGEYGIDTEFYLQDSDRDAVLTRNLGPVTPLFEAPVQRLEYRNGNIVVPVRVARTGDMMVLEIPVIVMAGALAGIVFLIALLRKGSRKLFSLFMIGFIAGAAFIPAPVNAATDPPTDGQYFYAVDGGFTQAQFDKWIGDLVRTKQIPQAVADQIKPAGPRVLVGVERIIEATASVNSNDADRLALIDFDAKARAARIVPSADSAEPIGADGMISITDPDRLFRVVPVGGIEFNKKDEAARPELRDEYTASVMYRGIEMVLGWGGFSTVIGDLNIITVITEYFIAAAAGTGGGGAGAGAGTGAGGAPAITIEPVEPPIDTITEGAVPLAPEIDSGTGTDTSEIPPERVPLAVTPSGWSVLSLFFVVLGLALAMVPVVAAAFRREGRKSGKVAVLRLLTIVLAAATLLVWLLLDNFTSGYVFFTNSNTLTVGLCLVVTIVVCVITNVYEKKKEKSEAGDSGER